MKMNASLRHARGQGMTEYIIIVALIAVAAIGVFKYFGQTATAQAGAAAAALAGNSTAAATATTAAKTSSGKAQAESTTAKTMATFSKTN